MTTRPERKGVMLCKPATSDLVRKLGPYCYAQPKLRGQRCRVLWMDDLPLLLSSYGNTFHFFEHIQLELQRLPKLPYDGELYVHDPEWTQEKINSVCGRTENRHPESDRIEFHIFDIAEPVPQRERIRRLDNLVYQDSQRSPAFAPHIVWVETEKINTELWMNRCNSYIEKGYEGIILRAPEPDYSPISNFEKAKHLSTILKFKPSEKDSYPIIGMKEGEGWAAGMLGAFIVGREGEASFSVGTGPELTKAKRQKYWQMYQDDPSSIIGKNLLVKHEPISTVNGIPICTVAYELLP